MKEVLLNLSFLYITMSITFLYWVLTGIQYWFSDYLITELKADPNTVYISYGVISITGPVIGVIAGGNVTSALGGYKSKKALYVTCLLAFVCLSCAIPIAFVDDYITVVVLLWFLLFAGGFILPSMTGIMLNTVDMSLKTQANSIANISYNLLGFLPAPFVYGSMCDIGGVQQSTRIAMKFLMFMPILSCLFLLTASC